MTSRALPLPAACLRPLVAALLAIPLLAAQPVLGVPIDGTVTQDGLSRTTGNVFATLSARTVGWVFEDVQGSSVDVRVSGARVEVWDYPLILAGTSPNAPGSPSRYPLDLPGEKQNNFTFSGTIHAEAPDNLNETVSWGASGDGTYYQTLENRQQFEIQSGPVDADDISPSPPVPAWPGAQVYPAVTRGQYRAVEQSATNLPAGVMMIYAGEVVFEGRSGSIQTGASEASVVGDPLGNAYATRQDRIVVWIIAEGFDASWHGFSPRLFVDDLWADLDGELEIRDVSVASNINDTFLQADRGLFRATGQLTLDATWGDRSATWRISGNATTIELDGVTVAREGSNDAVVAVIGTGIGLTILGLLLRKAFLLRGANRAEPLAHPARQALLVLVERRPGLSIQQLQQETGLARATLRFHLHVLVRGHVLDQRRRGATLHVYPNSGSFDFHAGPQGEIAKDLVAAVAHPIRARICELLEAGYRTTDAMVLQSWPGGEAPTPDALRYHCRVLEASGIVDVRREGRNLRLESRVRIQDVMSRQALRYKTPLGDSVKS